MAEIPGDKNGNAQELRDIQEAYRKRKKQVQENGEADVRSARDEKQEKLNAERKNSAAAVNHVRKENQERLDQLKNESDSRVTYERKNIAQKLDTTRESGQDKIDQLKEGIAIKENQLKERLVDASKKEREAQARERTITAQIQETENQRRQNVAKSNQEDINAIEQRAAQEKLEVNRQHSLEMRKMTEENRKEVEQNKLQAKLAYDQQKSIVHEKLKQQQTEGAKRFENDRKMLLDQQTSLKTRSQAALAQEKQNAEQEFTEINKQNAELLKNERTLGANNQELTRRGYAKEIERQHKQSDAYLHEQTEAHQKMKVRLDAQHKEEIADIWKQHNEAMLAKDQFYKDQAHKNELIYKQELANQRRDFEVAKAKNDSTYKDTLRLQKETFAKNVTKEKADMMKDIGRYSGKNQDPFYQINMANARVEETDSHYVIRAEVPEHEKDNVKIYVKDGTAVIHGNRRFEERLEGENAKLSTNNYQTFREEFNLDRPVREKMAERFWQNGILTYKIPKA